MWRNSLTATLKLDLPLLQTTRCLRCQFHGTAALTHLRANASLRNYATKNSTPKPKDAATNQFSKPTTEPIKTSAPGTPARPPVQFQQNQPIRQVPHPSDENFIPPTLDRPIGTAAPPEAGENTGVDSRSYRQRRDDFVDYDTHIKRRKELYVPYPSAELYEIPAWNPEKNQLADHFLLSRLELGKSPNRTSANGPISASQRVKPSSRTRASSAPTRPSTSPICAAQRCSHRRTHKTPPPSSKARSRS
jgi:hypothetical protein